MMTHYDSSAINHLHTDLVHEDDAGLTLPGRREQRPHQLLPLADELAGEARGRDVEEGGGGLRGHGPGQHRLAVTRGPEQQEASCRGPQPGEQLGPAEISSNGF